MTTLGYRACLRAARRRALERAIVEVARAVLMVGAVVSVLLAVVR